MPNESKPGTRWENDTKILHILLCIINNIYVTGNMDNPVFCKMPRHYTKCQKSLGNKLCIHNTSFA
jgi:hypothetical protein